MRTEDFISDLQEYLEFDTKLEIGTNFQEVEEWDSLSAMVLMSYVNDNFDFKITPADLESLTSISSLIDRIGRDKFED